MTVENSYTIAGLDKALPRFNDKKSEGDDHLRLIKQVLKAQFPGVAGNGFSKSIQSSEDELNTLVGITSNVQGQLESIRARIAVGEDSLYAPINTHMLFGEGVVPTGWSVVHYGTDGMIRVVDPAVHSSPDWSGGTDDPIHYVAAHTHDLAISSHKAIDNGTIALLGDTVTGSGGADWNPRYVEAVVGKKD